MTTNTDTSARAWIGSLAAYNAGRLVGAWIDLDGLDAEEATDKAKEAMRPMIAGWMTEAEAFDELHAQLPMCATLQTLHQACSPE